jgi:copper chaperone NosL
MTTLATLRVRRFVLGVLLAPLALLACGVEPGPVHVGSDECAHCSMMISDRRFAAQVLNTKGRAWKFDSIECLRGFLATGELQPADIHSAWVADSDAPEQWLRADDARFLHSAGVRSPMGGGLAAYADAAAARSALARLGGVAGAVVTWAEVIAATPATATPAAATSATADEGAHAHPGHGD